LIYSSLSILLISGSSIGAIAHELKALYYNNSPDNSFVEAAIYVNRGVPIRCIKDN